MEHEINKCFIILQIRHFILRIARYKPYIILLQLFLTIMNESPEFQVSRNCKLTSSQFWIYILYCTSLFNLCFFLFVSILIFLLFSELWAINSQLKLKKQQQQQHGRNALPYILDNKGCLKCYFLDLSGMHLRVKYNQSKEDRKTVDDSEAGRWTHTCVRL